MEKKDIIQIREQVFYDSLGESIEKMRQYAAYYHIGWATQALQAIDEDYNLLKQYLVMGVPDEHRWDLLSNLHYRMFEVASRLLLDFTVEENTSFRQAREMAQKGGLQLDQMIATFSHFDQELAMASLYEDAEERMSQIYIQQFEYRKLVFNHLYTSYPLTEAETSVMVETVLSPFVQKADALLMVSAMTLAQRVLFSPYRFKALIKICLNTIDIEIRERALVGVMLQLPSSVESKVGDDIFGDEFCDLIKNKDMQREIYELQIQMILCMNTEKYGKEMHDDIMPTLTKGAQKMQREMDDEGMGASIEEILHPDSSEREMEEVEGAIDRMRELQKSGADIFFGGFSSVKRYAFFYTLMNWFCPFYMEHPDINAKKITAMPRASLDKLLAAQPFCNSDKYSFILTFSKVIEQLPKEMVDILNRGEMMPAFDEKMRGNATLIRRIYLQDIYRFFNLYPSKQDFRNPFADIESALFFNNEAVIRNLHGTNYCLQVCRQLYRNGYHTVLTEFYGKMSYGASYYKLKGMNELKLGNRCDALSSFESALQLEPENKELILKIANIKFDIERYIEAKDFYEKYIELFGEDSMTNEVAYRYAYSMMRTNNEKALKKLFKLHYEDGENVQYRCAIARAYMLQNSLDKAITMFESANEEEFEDMAMLDKGAVLWALKRRDEAVQVLKNMVKRFNITRRQLKDWFYNYDDSLMVYLYYEEIEVLSDLIFDNEQ